MRRRQRRGLDALSSGMIAVGAGDRGNAVRYALQARKSLPNEPLTHLLRAQAAQLTGDKATARRIFEAMLATPDTEQLGLRGLFLEAQRVSETEAARQFAERAVRLNPRLNWPVEALLDIQCKAGDWTQAQETLATAKKYGHMDKLSADRKRAVLLTAQAQALEDKNGEKALALAQEAHGLAPTLVPAAAIAGRLLAARGSTPRAAKVLRKTWAKAPHPDLATAYAYARIGDSPRDRLDRIKQLAALNPHSIESPIAIATAAIEAMSYDEARHALAPLLDGRLTQRVATLMARIEGEEHGDQGRVREWLARAVNAPRDPAWTADGVVSEQWAAVSPVTGTLDAFQWRVPVDELNAVAGEELTSRVEALVALGASRASPLAGETAEAAAPARSAKASAIRNEAIDVNGTDEAPAEEEQPVAPVGHEPVKPAAVVRREALASERRSVSTAPAPRKEPLSHDALVAPAMPTREVTGAANSERTSRRVEPARTVTASGDARARERPGPKGDTRGKRRDEPARVPSEQDFRRAPDDPGPEGDEPGDLAEPLRQRRAT
jgi:HemY protein